MLPAHRLPERRRMQARREALSPSGLGMLALCALLLMGHIAQGAPVEKARYKWVRCRPEALDANCIEEQGPEFEIPQGQAKTFLSPKNPSLMMKNLAAIPNIFLSSGEESGSGMEASSGVEAELASEMESSIDYTDMLPDPAQNHPDSQFGLNLKDEDFIL